MTCNLPPMPPTPERATDLLLGLFDAVGDGCHALTVSIAGGVMTVPFHNSGEYTDVDVETALTAIALLSRGRIGGAVMRTHHADDTSRVLGWRLTDCTARPLNRAEIFDAYCTNPATGEPIPPESGTEYADAPVVGG